MSNIYEEHLEVEIIKFENDDEQFEEVNSLIEYVAEDADFEQYEYIELEESDDKKGIANVWKQYQIKTKQELGQDKPSSAVKEDFDEGMTEAEIMEGFNVDDKSLIIKMETDNYFHNYRDAKFKCSNRQCKREYVSFNTQPELDRHNIVHLKQINENECPICNKILANQNKLQFHMQARHVTKTFQCDNCAKTFRSKDNLRLHMSHHRKHFLVECRACHKTYKSMQSLRYHLRQHFEHHQCETCGMVFEHKKLLVGHIVAKHNQALMVQCQYCTRMFSRADVRDAHEREIHKDGKVGSYFKCNECDCAFDLRDELMSHKILNHYSGAIHTCNECGKHFKKKSLLDLHMSSHKDKTVQCNVCEMMFTFVTGLAKHRKLGRCKGVPPMTLKEGAISKEQIARIAKQQLEEITVNPVKKEKVLDIFSDLKEEIEGPPKVVKIKKKPGRKKKKLPVAVEDIKDELELGEFHLQDEPAPKSSALKVNTMGAYDDALYRNYHAVTTVSSSGRVIKRKLPPILFRSPLRPANIHKKPNVSFECDKCGMDLDTKVHLISHLNSHVRGQKHKCKNCEKTFCNLVSFKKHCAMAHRDENPFKEKRFQCDQCPKRYLTEFLLGQHKLSHLNLKSEKCSLCPFATNAPYDLKNHIKRIHHPSKVFVCTEENCEKAFKRRCDMENHRQSVHSLIKVYVKCPTCEAIVLEKGLQSHMINRHSEKATYKPFVCTVCGKAERYEKNLQRHYEAVHEPADRGVTYPCNECDMIFNRRRELTAHSFDHFDGVVHNCQECGNKYKSKKDLTNHMYSHRSKEWPCHKCDVVFQTKSGRSKHLRRHVGFEEGAFEQDLFITQYPF